MKKFLLGLSALILMEVTSAGATAHTLDQPDSVYLFSYSMNRPNDRNGLHFAWSRDQKNWQNIGNGFNYLRSDYGTWGREKRMLNPYLMQDAGTWHCVWSLNDKDKVFAHASSTDLVDWGRQSYPDVEQGANVLAPVLQYDSKLAQYTIVYADANQKFFKVTTKDFKTYSAATEVSADQYKNHSLELVFPEGKAVGQVHRVAWNVVDNLIKTYDLKQYKSNLYNEVARDDAQRFAGLQKLNATISLQSAKPKPISDMLMGIFFEDINYAADGGLYAELVQNRDFEYALSDKQGRDKNWNSKHSWSVKGEGLTFNIDSTAPIHANNSHYAALEIITPGAALVNSGFDGIPLKKGEKYLLSLFIKTRDKKNAGVLARLVTKNGEVVAQSKILSGSAGWRNAKSVLTASADAKDASLELQPLEPGRLDLDMISLFPDKTFKGRKNGLRADLAQVIGDIKPRFVRFPGGCVAHGDGLENIYRWKNTIGPLEARKPQRNIWNYHQTAGLGYFEYFQFCEDIGAEPLPVIAAGVPCQNSSTGGAGQQGGIPLEEMDEYIQEILDLVEWANGSVNTTWGKKRAESGHPKPFNLKYIGIGNEDLISDVFEQRFTMIYNALKEKHPEITVIGTVGPASEGTDYEEGWELATKLKVPMVDEHYYQNPGWFIYNQDYYDKYDRSKSKVYLGEYAAHLPGRPNNLETALAEALYLTAMERNGDIVSLASYAPLLAKEGHTQWNPNMIYFNNTEVKPTVGYEVQKLFGLNSGTEYLPATMALNTNRDAVRNRVAYSIIRDIKSKDVILKLVNLLPVPVSSQIDLKDIKIAATKASKSVLQGNPADRDLKVLESQVYVTEKFGIELQPYSFTVLRVKTKD